MDYRNLKADKELWLNTHYTLGRTAPIDRVVVHHNAGVNTTEDVHRTWQTRVASAHYQVEPDGTVGQLVHDADTAWHCVSWNARSIGVEHSNSAGASSGWPISAETRESGAHLVAAICYAYGLGRPALGANIFGHGALNATYCPGGLLADGSYILRAMTWFDAMSGTAPKPADITVTETVQEDTAMILIRTKTPWGTDAYATVTETAGAAAQDDVMAQVYAQALGSVRDVPWEHYQALIREAWTRHNSLVGALGGAVTESVNAAAQRVIDATKAV